MSSLDSAYAGVIQRNKEGLNPYTNNQHSRRLMCLLVKIDAASYVRMCDAASNLLMLFSQNESGQPRPDFQPT